MTEYVRQDADLIVLEDLVACPYCLRSFTIDGPSGIFKHLLDLHPESWQGQAIIDARRGVSA